MVPHSLSLGQTEYRDIQNNKGVVLGNIVAESLSISLGPSSQTSREDQFLEALIGGDSSAGVDIVSPEPGTCSWILTEDLEFRAWKTARLTPPLWICGSPGCGKSVISSFILKERQKWTLPSRELSPGTENPKKTIVAGCFCDRNPKRQTPIWILRTLLYEILRQNREFFSDTSDFWQDSGNPKHPILNLDAFESMDSLAKLLGKIATDDRVADTHLVVDGQYQRTRDAADLCDLIKLVSSHCGGTALPRWIISTRPNDFDRVMEKVYVVDMLRKNREDISKVAISRMERLRRFNSAITESLRDEVVEILKQRADGMFLWLSLALDSLEDGIIWDINIVKEKLQSIPYNVQDIYGKVFENADKKVQTLLRWVSLAGCPLKVGEVPVIWALQDGAKSIQEIEKLSLRPETVRSSIESNLKALLALHGGNTIHPAHPSVKDFMSQLFDGPEQRQEGKRAYGITKAETHKQMAEACLAYLSLDEIQDLEAPEPPVDDSGMIDREKREKVVERYLGKYVFLEYSIKFLGLHLRESGADGVQVNLRGMEEFFSADSAALRNWVRGYDLLMRWTHGKYNGASSGVSLLSISARLNLIWLAERCISPNGLGSASTLVVNVPGLKTLAGGMSSVAVVRQQIINMPDIKGWRALHVAVDSESEEVAKWLLENGASVDSETVGVIRPGCTALHLAASKSSDAGIRMVQELLRKGANPSFPTRFGGNTPLHDAVQGGTVEIVRSLLLHKSKQKPAADPNAANHSGITALHKAVTVPGLEAIVEVLLENGANPEQPSTLDKVAVAREVKGVQVGSTLKAVTSLKPATMWKMTADTVRGAATNQTALHMAVRANGTEETVKKLLEWYKNKKLMIRSKDSMGYTPLHVAVDSGVFTTHTKLLVESEMVDVDAQDNNGRTPLILYMRRLSQPNVLSELGDPTALKETLDILLNAGASPGAKDKDGMSSADYARQAKLTWAVEKCNSKAPPEKPNSNSVTAPEQLPTPSAGRFTGSAARLKNKFQAFSKK